MCPYPFLISENKSVVIGMVSRDGKAYAKHIPNNGKWTLLAQIKQNVSPLVRVVTDEWGGYIHLPKYGYRHDFVKHKETYAVGDIYTQNVENLWSQIKRGITGVYRVVSKNTYRLTLTNTHGDTTIGYIMVECLINY